jgi:hypothetical protein
MRRMRIADDRAAHRAQPEALGGVEPGGTDAPVVEDQRFGMPPLEEELAILGAGDGLLQDGQRATFIERGLERAEGLGLGVAGGGGGHGGPFGGWAVSLTGIKTRRDDAWAVLSPRC